MIEDQTRAGHPGFGFLQLRQVDCLDTKPPLFEQCARFRKGSRHDDNVLDEERVRSSGFFVSNVNQFKTPKRLRIDEGSIDQNRIVPYVKAYLHGDSCF